MGLRPYPFVQELLGGLWGTGSFKKGEVEAVRGSQPTSQPASLFCWMHGISLVRCGRDSPQRCGASTLLHKAMPVRLPCLPPQQVVQDMLLGGAAHTHDEAEGEQEGCPACGAPAVEAEPAAKVYLSLRRPVACIICTPCAVRSKCGGRACH